MVFNSIQFFIFLTVIVGLYYALPARYRWMLLLAGNYFFYMCWNVKYVFLILFSTAVSYFTGLQMGKITEIRARKKYLWLTCLLNLAILFFFKYFNFLAGSLNGLFADFEIGSRIPYLKVLLPVGISFYTFQMLSYSIDVYRGHIQPEKHPGIFALSVSFFPQLVAGPIERAPRMLPQFAAAQRFDDRRISSGLRLILWGLFKKLVVADRLALFVNVVYDNYQLHNGWTLLVATYFFAIQIYCDFSAYSDIAVGTARLLGYRLIQNFERPYFAHTISDFWRRWHISLSTWLRDYLFLPIAYSTMRKIPGDKFLGIKPETWSYAVGMAITMLIGGIWHGANWTFIVWGGLFGLYSIVGHVTQRFRKRWLKRIGIPQLLLKSWRLIFTFHLVCLTWIFFRAPSISVAGQILTKIVSLQWGKLFISALDQFVYGLFAIFVLIVADMLQERYQFLSGLKQQPVYVRWSAYFALTLLILLIGVFNGSQFIYFQF